MLITTNDSAPIVAYAQECKRVLTRTQDEHKNPNGSISMRGTGPFSVDIDASARSIGKKIREAKKKRYSIVAVIGEQEVKESNVVADFTGIPGGKEWMLASEA